MFVGSVGTTYWFGSIPLRRLSFSGYVWHVLILCALFDIFRGIHRVFSSVGIISIHYGGCSLPVCGMSLSFVFCLTFFLEFTVFLVWLVWFLSHYGVCSPLAVCDLPLPWTWLPSEVHGLFWPHPAAFITSAPATPFSFCPTNVVNWSNSSYVGEVSSFLASSFLLLSASSLSSFACSSAPRPTSAPFPKRQTPLARRSHVQWGGRSIPRGVDKVGPLQRWLCTLPSRRV